VDDQGDLWAEARADAGADLDLADRLTLAGSTVAAALDASDKGADGGGEGSGGGGGVRPYSGDSLYDGDPSQPLDDARYERFVALYLETGRGGVAYRAAVSPTCKPATAVQQASRLRRRPEVAARLQYLIREQRRAAEQKAAGGGTMDKAQKLRVLEEIIRAPAASTSDRVQAVKAHNALAGEGKARDAVPDPAFLADYLRRAEELGRDPVDLARADTGQGGRGDADGQEHAGASDRQPGDGQGGCGHADGGGHQGGGDRRPDGELGGAAAELAGGEGADPAAPPGAGEGVDPAVWVSQNVGGAQDVVV